MSLPVIVLHSGMTGALKCAGVVNNLNSLLHTCLVTGWNTKAVSSLVVEDNEATVTTSTNHDFQINENIVISGANQSAFNDSFKIKAVLSNTEFTFDIAHSDTTATGTIEVKYVPLGWAREFNGTNISVYRAPEGERAWLRVDDTLAQYSTINAYEDMTNIDTGTGMIGPVYWKKSNQANTTIRNWILIGTKRSFYFCAAWHSAFVNAHGQNFFGDYISLKANDTGHVALMGDHSTTIGSYPSHHSNYHLIRNDNTTGQFLLKNLINSNSINFWKNSLTTYYSYSGLRYPSLANNGLHLHPIQIVEATTNYFRGYFPGLYASLENTGANFVTNYRLLAGNDFYISVLLNVAGSGIFGNCFYSLSDWYEG